MSFIISTQAELLKTKRTASFWLSIIGAALIPTILFIALMQDDNPDGAAKSIYKAPWLTLFNLGWQILSVFLLPMYIILVSTLITQIEYKNNAWKQVFSSPQSLGNIFFSKFVTIHIMIILSFLLINLFLIMAGVLADVFTERHTFLQHSIDWEALLKMNGKLYISILGMSAIQYWLSLRFKSFIAPVGIGLALLIGGIIAINFQWKHIAKYPYAFPIQTLDAIQKPARPYLENHEWNSIGYFAVFILVGFLDMKLRKEKG